MMSYDIARIIRKISDLIIPSQLCDTFKPYKSC